MSFFLARTPYQGDNSGRGPSGGVWFDLPDEIRDPNQGILDGDDFQTGGDYPTTATGIFWNGYSTYGYTGATLVDGATQGGAITIASDGDNEGLSLHRLPGAFTLTTSYKKLWFECRIKKSAITDAKNNFFIGLMEPLAAATAIPITTSDAMADKNCIGFFQTAAAGTGNGSFVRFIHGNSSQTFQMATSAGMAAYSAANVTTSVLTTLAADTYVKLGFKYDPNKLDANLIRAYVNGAEVAGFTFSRTNMTAATFPTDTNLSFMMGVMNASASTPGSATIDWWMCAQSLV